MDQIRGQSRSVQNSWEQRSEPGASWEQDEASLQPEAHQQSESVREILQQAVQESLPVKGEPLIQSYRYHRRSAQRDDEFPKFAASSG